MRVRLRLLATAFGLGMVLLGGGALAGETTTGSKNFRTPATVPNFFSNEAGPLLGPAAETRRGQLYSNQTPPAPQVRTVTAAAPNPRGRQHVALAEPRGRILRGRREASIHHGVARVVLRGRAVERTSVVRHVAVRVEHVTHAASATHPTHAAVRPARIAAPHRHARS